MKSRETWLGVAFRSSAIDGQDRVHEADAHEGDDAGEGDGVDRPRLVPERCHERSWSRCGEGGDQRCTGVVVEAIDAALQGGGAVRADGGELRAPGVRDGDEHGARVGGVARLAHQAVLGQPRDDRRHRGLGHQLGGGQLGHPHRAHVVETAQDEQGADAAAAVGLCPQNLRDERDAALELCREIFDRHTI